jgi:hypothetical protein
MGWSWRRWRKKNNSPFRGIKRVLLISKTLFYFWIGYFNFEFYRVDGIYSLRFKGPRNRRLKVRDRPPHPALSRQGRGI